MQPQTLTLSSVGQITIPRNIRKLLGLESGAKLDVAVDEENNTITLKKQKTFDEIMAELEAVDKKYPTPSPDPRTKHMSVGEMSLELAKNIKGDTWV
ncbi:AbrB/MazE/SpoVT family DNA-binding domain-containing protein [Candidatus Saccharibacteria bacterium]|nr:AbrB/MazE/SpoVT family DNA-binding domain-containing protein [Candidatus Saccharibacteria bacterium]